MNFDPVDEPVSTIPDVNMDQRMPDISNTSDPDLSVGAYRRDGDVVVYADSSNVDKLYTPEIKRKCYDYRLSLGLAHSGISPAGSPFPLAREGERVPTKLKAEGGNLIWRIEFKLNSMV